MTDEIFKYTFYVNDSSTKTIRVLGNRSNYASLLPNHDFSTEKIILNNKEECIVNLPPGAGEVIKKDIKLNFIPKSLFSVKINKTIKKNLVNKLEEHGLSVGYTKNKIR